VYTILTRYGVRYTADNTDSQNWVSQLLL